MKRELRLAVVIYGGASLAVYMHGVTKELLRLVRASKALHDPGAYAQSSQSRGTEGVYADLLRRLNERGHTRVVIDVVAGASAGAINGILLSQALVDDSDLDAHTELWLTTADADELRSERVSRLRKWYLYPLLRGLSYWLPASITRDDEIRGKLTRLVRTSWFRPPFSGAKLCRRLLDALANMRRNRLSETSLLPPGQRLDVYASLTDLFGYPRLIQVHDRLVAREREHAVYCRLTHAPRGPRGFTDFSADNAPALVWAARASSSYAGAFDPYQHRELMAVLKERRQPWPGERRFLQRNLFDASGQPLSSSLVPEERTFVDGGIVNNKPFGAALDALQHRPADRQVERIMLYVEPDPNVDDAGSSDQALGFLGTIRAAASTIPRNQPILSDLEAIMAQSQTARTNRRIIEARRPLIHAALDDVLPAQLARCQSADEVQRMGAEAERRAEDRLGFAYGAYLDRRRLRLVDALAEEWSVLTQTMAEPQRRQAMLSSIEDACIGYGRDPLERAQAFLERFDLGFRVRRVQFMIRRLNRVYGEGPVSDSTRDAFARYKQQAYGILEDLQTLRSARALQAALARSLIRAATRLPLSQQEAQSLLDGLAAALDLARFDRRINALLADLCQTGSDLSLVRQQLLENLGFFFYDVLLTTPGGENAGPDPLTDLRVERISPADADTLAPVFEGLRCRNFMGFLGFFNRSYREHDYLWGRLNAAERIVDLLLELDGDAPTATAAEAKRALACRIVDEERGRLRTVVPTLNAVEGLVRR